MYLISKYHIVQAANNNFYEVSAGGYNFYIYFLVRDKDIIYIGKTKNIKNRINVHRVNKDFDSFYYIKTGPYDYALMEDVYISAFNPICNVRVNGQNYSNAKKYYRR